MKYVLEKIKTIFEDGDILHKYNLEVHQIINNENLDTVEQLVGKATFEKDYEKKLVLDYVAQIKKNAKLIEKVFNNAEANVQQNNIKVDDI